MVPWGGGIVGVRFCDSVTCFFTVSVSYLMLLKFLESVFQNLRSGSHRGQEGSCVQVVK